MSLSYVQADVLYRDDAKEVVIDKERSLMWQDDMSVVSAEKTYAGAKKYCENLDFAEYNDWYLPTVGELKSIVKADNYPRAIFKVFQNVASDYYWSSSEHTSEYAWIVLFIYKDVVYYHKTDINYVRCVRKAE
ncbi:DUF1566 domain-containing protein [Campylobacterota bacterium]